MDRDVAYSAAEHRRVARRYIDGALDGLRVAETHLRTIDSPEGRGATAKVKAAIDAARAALRAAK
jgi:hypothetical protein